MIRAAALALLLASSGASAESWLYRVQLDPAAPLAARIEVELPAGHRAQDFSVQVRGTTTGVMPQARDIRCDGVPVVPDNAGAWRVQGWNCVRLSWTITFSDVSPAGVDATAQANIYDRYQHFWLLSEPASLLRPVGDLSHQGVVEIIGGGPVHGGAEGGTEGGAGQRRFVPTVAMAPEFYVIGELPTSVVRAGAAELIYVNALDASLGGLVGEDRRQIGYLTRVAGVKPRQPLRSVVVWLPIAEPEEPRVAAGYRTIVISGVVQDGRLRQIEQTLALLLREQFVQITPAKVPLWIRESLAQYYALKALRRTDLSAARITAIERRYVDPMRAPKLRLREAQRRLQPYRDRSQFGVFHTDGATFWDRLDRAIVRKSGFRTLDSLLPRLFTADWTDDRLPPAIVERMRRYAGDSAVDELLAMYVGD